MSRARSSSTASSIGASSHPLSIKLYRLSLPSLLNSHNYDQPDLPPLPQSQLILPKSPQQVYVGEEFKCILAVKLLRKEQQRIEGSSAMNKNEEGGQQDEGGERSPEEALASEDIHIRAEAEAPDGSRTELLSEQCTISKDKTWTAHKLAYEVSVPGTWILRTSVRYDAGLEEKIIRRAFRVEAASAISVRTKVSKGSSALKAHVLEAQIENLSDSTLVIESCALNAANGWEATAPNTITTEEESTGGGIVLRPRDVNQWSFVLRGGWAPEAGPLAIGWRREPLGAKGWQTTGSIRV